MEDAGRIVGLYQRHAAAFDRLRDKTLFERSWIDRFVQALPARAAVLDIGCGSGEPIAADLIGRGLALTGIDSSAAMIDLCRSRFPEAKWLVGDMRDMALGMRFDGLLAWNSFFHLTGDDQRAMFPLFAAHARPGGLLMFTSGPDEGVAMGTFEGEPLYHASLSPDEYQALLEENGFAVIAHALNDQASGGVTVWLSRRVG